MAQKRAWEEDSCLVIRMEMLREGHSKDELTQGEGICGEEGRGQGRPREREGGKDVEEGAVISNAWKSQRPRGESNRGGVDRHAPSSLLKVEVTSG